MYSVSQHSATSVCSVRSLVASLLLARNRATGDFMVARLPEMIHQGSLYIGFEHEAVLMWPGPAGYHPDAATDSRLGVHKYRPPCGPTDVRIETTAKRVSF